MTEETKQKWRQETREELGASRGSLTYLQEESEKWRKETREALIAVRGAQARVAEVYKECLQNTQTSLRHVFGGIVQEESLEIEESVFQCIVLLLASMRKINVLSENVGPSRTRSQTCAQ